MNDDPRVIICPRCEGSGAIWCYDLNGVSHPKSVVGSCGAWSVRPMSTTDHTCPCDVCGGSGRIAVLPAADDAPLAAAVQVTRGTEFRWRFPQHEEPMIFVCLKREDEE